MSDKRTLPERLRAANSELLAFGNDYSDLLLEAATEIDKLQKEVEWRRRKVQSGCGCVIDEDGETILNWCAAHSAACHRPESIHLRDEMDRMKEALEFYANRNNWDNDHACGVDIDYGNGDGSWKPDVGYMARRALRVLDDDD